MRRPTRLKNIRTGEDEVIAKERGKKAEEEKKRNGGKRAKK